MATLLSEMNMNDLKDVERLGVDMRNDYKLLTNQLNNIINRFHRYILIPTLQEKTVECVTANTFVTTNSELYLAIKNNSDVLPDGYSLPDGYTDVSNFLTDFETFNTYYTENCPDVYDVVFHPNMSTLYSEADLTLIKAKYDSITTFKNALLSEIEQDAELDVFNITSRLNTLVSNLLSTLG